MKTKKPVESKQKDFSNYHYCVVDSVNEKCKKILNSNLDDDLKVELIGLLQNPAPAFPQIIQPYVTWTTSPNNVEITCQGE